MAPACNITSPGPSPVQCSRIGRPAPSGAMRMQHAFRPARRAGGVNEISGIVGGGVDIVRDGRALGEPRQIGAAQDVEVSAMRLVLEGCAQRQRGRAAVARHELGFLESELRGREQRHIAGGDRREIGERRICFVAHADHHARARRKAERLQTGGETPHFQIEFSVGPALRAGVADDGERRGVGPQPRIFGEAIAREIEARRNGVVHERNLRSHTAFWHSAPAWARARRHLTNVEANGHGIWSQPHRIDLRLTRAKSICTALA